MPAAPAIANGSVPPESATTALEVRAASVRFGGIAALTDVSLAVRPGELRGLIGPNGAGKTTLFDLVSGLTGPTKGSVWLNGVDVTRRSPTWRARHGLRRTFQRQQVFGHLTVAENLLVASEWRGGGGGLAADLLGLPTRRKPERERRRRVDELLERCHLDAVADTQSGSIPIGQARLLEVGRALMDQPQVLLADEPTSGLDEAETDRLGRVLTETAITEGTAVLLVEHDVGFVMDHCHRITVLHLGQVLAEGEPDEIRRDPIVRSAYLG